MIFIPFELHITVADVELKQLDTFTALCRQMGGKPLLIELSRGDYCTQPMFNTVMQANDLFEAVEVSEIRAAMLGNKGFTVKRIKIEIPAYSYGLTTDKHTLENVSYFEWHGRIDFEREQQLLEICEKHTAHLSKNALKDNAGKRFITLREFGSKEIFENRIAALVNDLQQNGWAADKQQAEYCLYDTNVVLDKNWLTLTGN